MEKKLLEVYSEAGNHGVVRMPQRRFPGSVIQGDGLWILLGLAESICKRLQSSSDDEELVQEAEELRDALRERLVHYEGVLREHNIPLPYVRARL